MKKQRSDFLINTAFLEGEWLKGRKQIAVGEGTPPFPEQFLELKYTIIIIAPPCQVLSYEII